MFTIVKENDRVVALNDPDLSKEAVFLFLKTNPDDLSELKATPPAHIYLVGSSVARVGSVTEYKTVAYRQATLGTYEAVMAELLKYS